LRFEQFDIIVTVIIMAKLTDLPAEIIVQIMCEYRYIRHVLRLSSACSLTQQVWRDHAAVIAGTVLSFPRSELLEGLQLARLEAWTPGESLPELLDEDLNTAIRQHIQSFARNHYGARSLVKLANWRPIHWHVKWGQPQLRYCIQMFLLLRRFIVGYSHPPTLPAAYATLHSLSGTDAMFYSHITGLFEEKWEWHALGLGIELPTRDVQGCDPKWSNRPMAPLPVPWAFACRVFNFEDRCRPLSWRAPSEERYIVQNWQKLCERFGSERVKTVFGGDEIPWTEERAQARLRHN
jgi:hypothetical protein